MGRAVSSLRFRSEPEDMNERVIESGRGQEGRGEEARVQRKAGKGMSERGIELRIFPWNDPSQSSSDDDMYNGLYCTTTYSKETELYPIHIVLP